MDTPKQSEAGADTVSVPVELWDTVARLVRHAKYVSEHPASWPMLPEQMASEIRNFHIYLSEIGKSGTFLRLEVERAAAKALAEVLQ